MFKGKEYIKLIYYDWYEARPRYAALDSDPGTRLDTKEMREGRISLGDLSGELDRVATGLFALAQEYSIAATVAREYDPQRIQLAIDKAVAIASAYTYDFEYGYDDKTITVVDEERWASAESTYGKLDSMDKFLLAELGMGQLLDDAMKVVTLAYKKRS